MISLGSCNGSLEVTAIFPLCDLFFSFHPVMLFSGLLYCMEYLEENLEEWLGEELSAFGDDDYLIFDCPGQIELYSHLSVFRSIVTHLRLDGWQVAAVYCLDSQFAAEAAKYIAGTLSALSAMIQLELPHVNVLTKMDLCKNREEVEESFLFPDASHLRHALDLQMGSRFLALNSAVCQLLDEYSLVTFTPLDVTDEESVEACLVQVDSTVQFGEDQDVRTKDFGEFPDEEGVDGCVRGSDELDF